MTRDTKAGARFGAIVAALLALFAAMNLPVFADAAPAAQEDFGQYIVDHQDDLAPFFSDNADDIVRLGVPVIMQMFAWVVILTMLVAWGIDVLLSRGFSFFYAPAFADVKRCLIYATGGLVLRFVYTALLSLAVVFSLKFSYVMVAMSIAVVVLLAVALAAQVVWILYLYRTTAMVAVAFYFVVMVTHFVLGVLVAKSVIGLGASGTVTAFVDGAITPRLQAATEGVRHDLAAAQADRDEVGGKYNDVQSQIAQAKNDQAQLKQEIEQKKVSDIYVLSRVIQVRAAGDLAGAKSQLTAFLNQFPTSPLVSLAQSQLSQVNSALAVQQVQQQQAAVDTAKEEAQARAELLARAGKGEATLSEMRRALIGKTRAEVSNFLGTPAQTDSDTWGYAQQMIVNPLTNEKFGLMVYFFDGTVQGVDYNRNASQ